MSQIPAKVFRAYDVRGKVGPDIDARFAGLLGKAIGTAARREGRTTLSVGRDCRTHSPELHAALVTGLRSTGITVVDIGIVPTPLVYFSLFHLEREVQGGVMITGSHNAKEYNGFKICLGQTSIHGERIQDLRCLIEADDFEEGQGGYRERPVLRDYIDTVKKGLWFPHTRIKVVVDCGNGTAGPVAIPLLTELGFDVIPMFAEMDGNFPNHHPDPTEPHNLEALQKRVLTVGAAVGVAYDGDADRIGLIDERGQVLFGDKILILLARKLLEWEPGAAIVGEVKCSQTLFDDITARGGRAIMSQVGHSLIKARMKEEGALLAGEMSGHIFFKHRYFGYDDAIYATCRVLEVLARDSRPLSAQLEDLPQTYSTPEIRLQCPDEKKFSVVASLQAQFKADPSVRAVIDIDGARVVWGDGWGLVRASNTEPVLVVRCEAGSEAGLARIRQAIEGSVALTLARS